ncbi:hypothetical protein ACA910_011487 [Epithemia clementina (nom. ined.)]
MTSQDVQIPIFGKAGTSAVAQSDWIDGDTFDVEMLAEYLLDDAAVPSVTFDFKLDGALSGSGVVSPENSEDGVLPTVAEQTASANQVPIPAPIPSAPTATNPPNVGALAPMPIAMPSAPQLSAAMGVHTAAVMAPSPMSFVPLAPLAPATPAAMSPFAALSAVLVPSVQQPLLFQQHQVAAANAAKRRRVDQPHPGSIHMAHPAPGLPMFAMAGLNPVALLNGQQLAHAAAQAMQQHHSGAVASGRRKKSQAQIDRRRERNRILARRTRLRKKFFFESLQKEVIDLQQENIMLKELARQNLKAEDSKSILDECDAMEKLPPSVLEAIGENAADFDPKDFSLVRSIQNSQYAFVITDPSLQDNPVVFASDDFCTMTGYKREEILGRNCRFLQGAETSKEKVKQIEDAVKQGEDVTVTFANYKADGTPFWNKLFIAALRDAQNAIVNFIGVAVKVACPPPDDPEHGKVLPNDNDEDGEDDGEDDDVDYPEDN